MDYRLAMIQDELKEVKAKMNTYDQNIQKFYKEDWARVESIIRQVEIMYRPYTNRK
jgi:uncharacterized protein YqgQ